MALPYLNDFNVAIQWEIMPTIADGFFNSGPIMRYMKADRMKTFEGGLGIQENVLFAPMKGGFYQRGGSFNLTRSQIIAGTRFGVKTAYVNVSELIEDIEIELRGKRAAFDKVKTDLAAASMTLSAILEIAAMQYGQDMSGSGGNNQLTAFNGFPEALNDGIENSWDGQKFTSYGGQPRVDVNKALLPAGRIVRNGAVVNTSLYNDNINGPIVPRVLEHTYQDCVWGDQHPVLGITTKRGMALVRENVLPLLRLTDTKDPTISWPGLKFNQATLIESEYMFGKQGENDPNIGNYYSSSGEGFLWFNPGPAEDPFVRLWVSASNLFQFGFTGFKGAREDNMVSGQILFAGNLVLRLVRTMRLLYGIA